MAFPAAGCNLQKRIPLRAGGAENSQWDRRPEPVVLSMIFSEKPVPTFPDHALRGSA